MGDFDRKQLEQLHAIGEYLQHIRQEQGRSLDDISAKTYIPLRILRALEGGQETVLPEAVFVQGFIRRYADALGLDGTSLSRNFPVERETVGYDTPERERAEPTQTLVETRSPAPIRPAVRATKTADREIAAPRRRRSSSLSLPIAIAGLLVFGGLAYALSRLLFAPERPAPAANSTAAPVAASPAPAAPAAAPTAAPAAPAAAPAARPANAATAPVSVAMNITADSWVQIETDGRIVFEGILKRGTQRNWSGQRQVTIVSGNAGGVSLSSGDGAAKPMGAPGTVEEATFTPNAPAAAN